ncbi:MAG: tripartite tricarboxylate transporter substrate binding protein [Rubrivivax sp.]
MLRSTLCRGVAAVLCLGALPAIATEPFPSRPITLVVTQGVGSGSDVVGRLIASYLGPALGQAVVVENRAGGTGIIGHQSVMRAAADGYTLLLTSTSALFIVPIINPNAKYEPSDFAPVASVSRAPFAVLVANTPAAPQNLAALTAALAARPQSFASSGVGALTHLGAELLLRRIGAQATHVPYKGSGAALTDLASGQVLFAVDSLTAAMPLIRGGKLRALAVSGNARAKSLPGVPTLAEAGLPGLEISAVAGLFAPKGTPSEVVDKIATATAKALESEEVQQRFAAVETEPLVMPARAFVDLLRQEGAVWQPLVRRLEIKMD